MQSYDIAYKWSGDSTTKATSDLQTFELLSDKAESPQGYSKARLILKEPKLYNETAVFHYRLTANDSNRSSQTKVELKIDEPIELIKVNISLGYKSRDFNEPARVERSKIRHDAPPSYEQVGLVEFDNTLKEYSYSLHHPEPGYFYRIYGTDKNK